MPGDLSERLRRGSLNGQSRHQLPAVRGPSGGPRSLRCRRLRRTASPIVPAPYGPSACRSASSCGTCRGAPLLTCPPSRPPTRPQAPRPHQPEPLAREGRAPAFPRHRC